MSVKAIQQLFEAEETARQLLEEAERENLNEKENSQRTINQLKQALFEQEKREQQKLHEKYEAEFQKISISLTEQVKKEIEKLCIISPEIRQSALETIINKVVN